MIAPDSSVVVASFAPWHESHELARGALTADARLAAHSALETYSVLTRLPDPFRFAPSAAVELLRRNFPARPLTLTAEDQASAPERLATAGVAGGAVYDGLIALTVVAAGGELVTLDRRAVATYERCGATVRLLT